MPPYHSENTIGLPSRLPRCSSLPDIRDLETLSDQRALHDFKSRIDYQSECSISDVSLEKKANSPQQDENQSTSTDETSSSTLHDKALNHLSGFFGGEDLDAEQCIGSPISVLDIYRKMPESSTNATFENNHCLPHSYSTPLLRRKSCLKGSSLRSHNNQSRVSFAPKLSVRYYDLCLGDNPSCSYGIPISLGWYYEEDEVAPKIRLLSSPVQRLSYNDRRDLLQSAGYQYNELRSTLLEVKRVQRQRLMTEMLMPIDNVVDAVVGGVQKLLSPNI